MKASQSHFSGLENRERRRSWPPRRKGGNRKRRRRERESGDGRNQRGLETSAQRRLSYSRPGPSPRPGRPPHLRRLSRALSLVPESAPGRLHVRPRGLRSNHRPCDCPRGRDQTPVTSQLQEYQSRPLRYPIFSHWSTADNASTLPSLAKCVIGILLK